MRDAKAQRVLDTLQAHWSALLDVRDRCVDAVVSRPLALIDRAAYRLLTRWEACALDDTDDRRRLAQAIEAEQAELAAHLYQLAELANELAAGMEDGEGQQLASALAEQLAAHAEQLGHVPGDGRQK